MSGLIINPYLYASGGGGGGLSVSGAWKASGSTSTVSCTVAITSGRLIIAAVSEYLVTTNNATVSDNVGGTTGWVNVGRATDLSSNGIGVSLFYKANAPSGITTITGTKSTGTADFTIIVHEVTGASTSSPFTGGEVATANGVSANGQTGTVTNGTANSIYFAVGADSAPATPATMTINSTGTTGTWALYNSTNSQELDAATAVASVPYLIVSSSAARGHGWAWDTTRRWACVAAAFH